MTACAANAVDVVPPEQDAGEEPWTIAFLVVDGVYNTELVAPLDVLEHARHYDSARAVEVLTVSPDGGPVTTAEGLRLQPDRSFESAGPIDVLVVPSARGSRDSDLENRELVEWVATAGGEARYVLSLCWGAFVLAEAGLLEGHALTTFPADYARFAERFPELDLRFNVSFVHDGARITSEGGVKSYDAAMYLADLLFGEDVAKAVGRGLLIPWPPAPDERPASVVRSVP